MIENIIILLVVNTLAPYAPIPPLLLAPLSLIQIPLQPHSAFHNMNLTRTFQPQDFKRSFRQSLRVHHPDHGGSQQVFQQIQGLKKIMQQPNNYYDLYNVTDADLSSSNMPLKQVIEIKRMTFFVELGIFYFIVVLYVLAFTIEQESKFTRKIMLGLTVAFLAYQYYIHEYPLTRTFIDFVDPYIPLFEQSKILKRTLIILLAVIRSYFMRKPTQEKKLVTALGTQQTLQGYKTILQKLTAIYHGRAVEKQQYEKSIWYKLRGWASKAISGFFILLLIKNMMGF